MKTKKPVQHDPTALNRPPFELEVSAVRPKQVQDTNTTKPGRWNRSPVCLHLPRSFCGLISFSVDHDGPVSSYVWLSRGMKKNIVLQSEDSRSGSYLVGAPEGSSDTVTINYSYGMLYLLYTDEATPIIKQLPQDECGCCCVQ